MFDQRDYRNALGRFATGVTIVTCLDPQGQPVGVTINSFSSVSLDPPLVLFCLERNARAYPAFATAAGFGVNVLSQQQQRLSMRFARDPFAWSEIAFECWDTGAPILTDSLACFECRPEASYPGGDHTIMLGRVIRFSYAAGEPLLYDQGRYATVDRSGL